MILTMNETPILFSGPMPKEIIEDRKTQTRRVVKPQPEFGRAYWGGAVDEVNVFRIRKEPGLYHHCDPITFAELYCPYGKPGDRLVLLGTWSVPSEFDGVRPLNLPLNVPMWSVYSNEPKPDWYGRNRPGRFMPKSMRCRMPRADITSVRVQRLKDITEADAKAEGVEPYGPEDGRYVDGFKSLWESIHGLKSWDPNQWVFVVEFKRVISAEILHPK